MDLIDPKISLVLKITNEIDRLKGILATQLQQTKFSSFLGDDSTIGAAA